MEYQEVITEAFANIEVTPRIGQAEAVNAVLTEFINNKQRNVVLSADTGTGKSVISLAVSEAMHILEHSENSITLMHTNSLVDQYEDMYDSYHNLLAMTVRGASHYDCEALSTITLQPVMADACARQELKAAVCKTCEYALSRKTMNDTRNLATNYSYYFVSCLWSNHLDPRDLVIFDEAHVLNDTFVSHNTITISKDKILKSIKECSGHVDLAVEVDSLRELLKIRIGSSNYIGILQGLAFIYNKISNHFHNKTGGDRKTKLKHKRLSSKYSQVASIINDLLKHRYEHVVDVISKDECVIKPVFAGKMSNCLLGKYNLFMSATVTKDYLVQTLQLDPTETTFVQLPTVFPAENKSIKFVGVGYMNYEFMNSSTAMTRINKHVNRIMSDQPERGLIMTPSFKLARDIADGIKDRKVFLHSSGGDIKKIIEQFKRTKGAVLISPSIFEGLDFKDDDSRWQIIVKAPFASLGDKRVKYIADNYPDIYKLMTLNKIIQGIGRSVRSPTDHAMTYILDGNAERLFKGYLNIWREQFNEIS